jgi:NADH-quinone oxidoreductase subunit L
MESFHVHLHVGEFDLGVAVISTAAALLAILLSWLLYGRKTLEEGQDDPLRRLLGPIFVVLENKYWVDEIYWTLFVNPYIALARFLAVVVDWRFWHDWFHDSVLGAAYRGLARFLAQPVDLGVIDAIANGLADITKGLADRMGRIQTGFVRNYALSVFIGVVAIIGYLILR